MKVEILAKEGELRFTLDLKKETREAVYGAAYVLTDRAYAFLEPAKTQYVVTLKPKKAASGAELEALAKLFQDELETQKLRWEIARNNVTVREHIVKQAIMMAQGAVPPPPPQAAPAEELSTEQKAEIDRLIAEVEAEIRDMGKKREVNDPKGISATWEEKHGKL